MLVEITDPEGWVAAGAAVIAAVAAVAALLRTMRGVNWAQPQQVGSRMQVTNLGPGVARNVQVRLEGGRAAQPPSASEFGEVHPRTFVDLGSFAVSSSYVNDPTVTITWGKRWRRKWSSPIHVKKW